MFNNLCTMLSSYNSPKNEHKLIPHSISQLIVASGRIRGNETGVMAQ